MFAILYGIFVGIGYYLQITGFYFYLMIIGFAVGLVLLQYVIGPKIVEWSMRIKYVSEQEYPKLHQMIAELAEKAGLSNKPKVGISQLPIPNAFAFGRTKKGSRVCVTKSLLVMYGSRIREYYADQGSAELGNQPHYLATALYKLTMSTARTPKHILKKTEGMKAFFINDPSRAMYEVRELKDIDLDMSGTIDQNELMMLSTKKISLKTSDKLLEVLSTHPNVVKRIKHLASLSTT
jgi:Zn-dependent protease with chaperone function